MWPLVIAVIHPKLYAFSLFHYFSFLDHCLFWTELTYWAFGDVCLEICTYSAMKYKFHPFVVASELGRGLLQWNSCHISASSYLWLWSSIRNTDISESRPLELCSLPFSSHTLCCNKEFFSHPCFKKKNTCLSLVYFYYLFTIIIFYNKIFLSVDHSSYIFWFMLAIDKSVSLDVLKCFSHRYIIFRGNLEFLVIIS